MKMNRIIIGLSAIGLMLSACTTEPPPAAPPTEIIPAPTATAIVANTPSPLPTDTPAIVTEPAPTEPAPVPTDTPAPADTPTPVPPIPAAIVLEPVADGFNQPVYITHAADGSNRLFVVERFGKIKVLQNGTVLPTLFLDIEPLIEAGGQEQGLLSMAFHPRYPQDDRVFVNYTNTGGDTVVAAYRVNPQGDQLDPASAQILLTVKQPYGNHNGGQLQFGPDGYLYIGMGDGGLANDPHGNGQNPAALLGKLLRIGVDFGSPYTVPADNPFVGDAAFRPEIWATGLRNPWRFSFDRLTGDLYIGDVGQNKFEEIDFEAAGSSGGLNFGWDVMEGVHCFENDSCDQTGLTLPIVEYPHAEGCSVTGGYVYRGASYPQLNGVYLYADYCFGSVWGLRLGESPVLMAQEALNISGFGEDEAGELYVVDLRGGLYRVTVP